MSPDTSNANRQSAQPTESGRSHPPASIANAITRRCIRCDMDLPLEAFSPHRNGRDGLNGACKACETERGHSRKHGITTLQKQQQAELQHGCATCGRLEPGAKGWVTDHDRTCCPRDQSCPDCRRGILCQWCNTALGYAGDDPERLRRMADYLELGTRLDPSQPRLAQRSQDESHMRIPTDVTNELTEIPTTAERSSSTSVTRTRKPAITIETTTMSAALRANQHPTGANP